MIGDRHSAGRVNREGRGDRPSLARALERLGSPAGVLSRHGAKVRGRAAFCPLHENHRTPALSLFTGRDGKPKWRCHVCDIGGDALDLEAMLSGQPVRDLIRDWGR